MRFIALFFLWLSALLALNGCGPSEDDDGAQLGNTATAQVFEDINEACVAECGHVLTCFDPETSEETLDRCVTDCLRTTGGSQSCYDAFLPAASCLVGMSCAELEAASSNSSDVPCFTNTVSRFREVCITESLFVCRPLVDLGEACVQQGCKSGMYCDDLVKVCKPGSAEGVQCGGNYSCGPGLACEHSMYHPCVPIPTEGQPCALDEHSVFICAEGFGCFPGPEGTVPGICQPLQGEGGDCSQSGLCDADLGCDYSTGKGICGPRRTVGMPCVGANSCASETYCELVLAECRPQAEALGKPCEYSLQCGALTCRPDESGTSTCGPAPVDGERCLLDCDEGFFCDRQ